VTLRALWKSAIIATAAVVLPFGCERPRPSPDVPPPPPVDAAVTIELRVVRHLKPSDINDSFFGGSNHRNNKGCRLSDQEILDYLTELRRAMRHQFGPNVDVTWNPAPFFEYRDMILNFFDRTFINTMDVSALRIAIRDDTANTTLKVNLYFTGWIAPASGGANLLAANTLDPIESCLLSALAGGLPGAKPYISINDLDYGVDAAGNSQQPPLPPDQVDPNDPLPEGALLAKFYTPDYFIQVHEMGHWLLRQGLSNPGDPNGEHRPANSSTLMRANGPFLQRHNFSNDDKAQITERLETPLGWRIRKLTPLDPPCGGGPGCQVCDN